MEKIIKKAKKHADRNISLGQLVQNYFVAVALALVVTASGWIANLGVVPLFLLAAFLFAPAFFAFLNLLFSVTHVLETIGKLLYNRDHNRRINTNISSNINKSNFKLSFLPILSQCVKGIFGFLLLNLLFSGTSLQAEDYIISRGQSMSLKLPDMTRFNVGNKEVLTYKLNESNKTLLIRGVSLGASEILVWNKGESTPTPHQIFVISKVQEAKFLHLAQVLGSLGLETKVRLPHLQVSGVIGSLKQYLQYKKIQNQHSDIILDEATLKTELKREILADVFQLFFNDYKDSLKCEVNFSEVTCLYPANEAPSATLKKYLSDKYRVMFIEHNNQKFRSNYSFKMKLIQMEQMDGEELRLGLEQLSASLGDLISIPLNKIVEKNAVLLAQKKVQMNTLAEPIGLIRPMSPAEFQIGADVPYTTTGKDGYITQTQWQFAGLKIKITLENIGDKVQINYETELTKPSSETNGSISGNKEKSSVVIDLNSPTQIFQISLKTEAKGVDQMPFINRIPLLGELFKSKSSQNNYKMITGIIEVKIHE
jgi:Flp pilus assembly secretin CpaC